jgi:hypothetical protein
MAKEWFQEAVMDKPPYNLGGWKKSLPQDERRRLALNSRLKNWSLSKRRLSAGRALVALANVTQDKETKEEAMKDSRYFFAKLKEN